MAGGAKPLRIRSCIRDLHTLIGCMEARNQKICIAQPNIEFIVVYVTIWAVRALEATAE